MKAKTKSSIFYVFSVFLFISACIGTSSVSGNNATLVPLPGETPTIEPTVVSEPTASPAVVAGSFADFQLFAAEIAAALQDRNVSFFDEHSATSSWLCLGEPDTVGVCKDVPADTTLEGIPVAHDWATYEVYSKENYKKMWQTRLASSSVLKLVAVANQFGGNPLMPMAGQSFLAIVSVADEGNPSPIQEVRVLFFEYYHAAWHISGEFVTVENIDSWLTNNCPRCYDTWVIWPE